MRTRQRESCRETSTAQARAWTMMEDDDEDEDAYLDGFLGGVLKRLEEKARCGLRMLRDDCGVADPQSCGCEEEEERGWRRGGERV